VKPLNWFKKLNKVISKGVTFKDYHGTILALFLKISVKIEHLPTITTFFDLGRINDSCWSECQFQYICPNQLFLSYSTALT